MNKCMWSIVAMMLPRRKGCTQIKTCSCPIFFFTSNTDLRGENPRTGGCEESWSVANLKKMKNG